jgi:hypothetical protein
MSDPVLVDQVITLVTAGETAGDDDENLPSSSDADIEGTAPLYSTLCPLNIIYEIRRFVDGKGRTSEPNESQVKYVKTRV